MTNKAAAAGSPAVAGAELETVLLEYMEVTERLQRTHETLQHEVIRLRDELASKNRELEVRRRLAALGELAAGVAHEVRNPLGAIQLYSGLLRKECGCLAPALKLIEKIEAGIRAIDGVVQDTLALSPRPGKLASRRLRSILEDAQELCRPTLAAHKATLRLDTADPAVCVLAEGDGLRRAVVNLIVNAAEASRPGGTIRVCTDAGQGGEVAVRVADEGVGLSDEVLERLFDPFFTTKNSGTGLGLTIAHRLVEALGGRLTARNRPEGGAEFTVTLPTSTVAEEADAVEGRTRRTSAA